MVKAIVMTIVSSIFLMGSPAFAQPDVDVSPTTEQKLAVYEQNKENPAPFVFLNIVPFGVGSFAQGDVLTGASIAIIDAISLGLFAAGYAYQGNGWSGVVLAIVGINGLAVGRGLSIGGPINYSTSQNNALRRELGLEIPEPEPYYNWTTNLFSYSTSF